MAKKKKSTKKKKVVQEAAVYAPNPFWAYTGAILLFIVALFLLLGGFGTGGNLPVALFGAMYAVFGWAAYLTPVALVYWGVYKFTSEDHRIPLGRVFTMLAVLLLSSGWLHTAFVKKATDTLGAVTYSGGHGGWVGETLGNAVLTALDTVPASILLFIFAVLAIFFAFGISPKVILKLGALFKRKQPADSDLNSLKAQAEERGFKLNEGVPIEHGDAKSAGKKANLKPTVAAAIKPEKQEALTAPHDPDWQFPSLSLLNQKQDKANAGDINGNAEIIRSTLANFNIDVEMEGANVGPTVTQYTLKPPTGVKLTKITALENNLALDLAATSIRMEAPIPGKRAVGIEVPNIKAATVRISSLLQSSEFTSSKSPLEFVIGKDIAGKPVVADLAKMPHLLVAGQTGSGKSVMINTFLTSLLYRNTPNDLKLILVDPKQVEMAPYDNIPHLLTPVIYEPEKVMSALKWSVAEMERRLKTMASVGKRNIAEYNNLKQDEGMPYIVIVIDEMADLMAVAKRDVEALIARLTAKARAAGIHLVLATQRPSVDVITGLIKANVPARIAFTVASQVDSQTIIDQAGADKLLGRGDMLMKTSSMPKPIRVQAAFIDDEETVKVTDFIRAQREPQYDDAVVSQPVQFNGKGGIVADTGASGEGADGDMFRDAVRVVVESRKASTSLLQRKLRIGYGRAARLMEEMEEQGIISQADGSRPRDVLITSVDQAFPEEGSADDKDDYLSA